MINIVHLRIVPLGQKMARYALERGCFNIVGAVDPATDKAGRELGKLCGIEPLGITVSTNLDDAINGKAVEVALVITVSSIVCLERLFLKRARI